MRSLPPLVAGPQRPTLPMADGSAAALAEWLITAAAPAGGRLAELLCGDPPLLVWAVCQADAPCRSVDEVAGWLAQHALEALQWPAGHDASCEDVPAPGADVWAQRVAAAVSLSDLAAQVAVADQANRDEAILGGLLYYAGDWLAGASPAEGKGPATGSDLSPGSRPGLVGPGLAGPGPAPPGCVDLAARVLAGAAAAPPGIDFDLDACRRRGVEAGQRWAAEVGGLADWLPPLAARLARLENRFQETLQQEKLTALAEFAAGAGHEINNPLTVIAGRAQLFLQEETNPERRRALALINAQAMRVYEMIADLRLFARPPQPELQQVALVELVDGLIAELAPLAAQEQISLDARGRRRTALDPGRSDATGGGVAGVVSERDRGARRARSHSHRVVATGRRRGDPRQRRRARRLGRATPAYFRSLLFSPAGRPRPGVGALEVLADHHQPRRPHRSGRQPRRRGQLPHHAARAAVPLSLRERVGVRAKCILGGTSLRSSHPTGPPASETNRPHPAPLPKRQGKQSFHAE